MPFLKSLSEAEEAVRAANKIMDEPYADPDGSEVMVARQFLRLREACSYAAITLMQSDAPPPIVVKDVRDRLFAAMGLRS